MNLDTTQLVALAAALGWASGLRLYAVVFLTGLAGRFGGLPLPEGLHVLESTPMLVASGLLLGVEFLADKIPWVDSAWDVLNTVIRIPAGAALAYGVFGVDDATWAAVAALAGGSLAATAHAAKTATRAAANTSPEPVSNLVLSLLGDAFVPAMLWMSVHHPIVFFAGLVLTLAVMVVALVLLSRFLRGLVRRLRGHWQPATPAAAGRPLG